MAGEVSKFAGLVNRIGALDRELRGTADHRRRVELNTRIAQLTAEAAQAGEAVVEAARAGDPEAVLLWEQLRDSDPDPDSWSDEP